MNKQDRELARDYKCIELIMKTEKVNSIVRQAEPFVKEYYKMLKYYWQRPVGYNEAGNIKEKLAGVKELNKQYRKLLNN